MLTRLAVDLPLQPQVLLAPSSEIDKLFEIKFPKTRAMFLVMFMRLPSTYNFRVSNSVQAAIGAVLLLNSILDEIRIGSLHVDVDLQEFQIVA